MIVDTARTSACATRSIPNRNVEVLIQSHAAQRDFERHVAGRDLGDGNVELIESYVSRCQSIELHHRLRLIVEEEHGRCDECIQRIWRCNRASRDGRIHYRSETDAV